MEPQVAGQTEGFEVAGLRLAPEDETRGSGLCPGAWRPEPGNEWCLPWQKLGHALALLREVRAHADAHEDAGLKGALQAAAVAAGPAAEDRANTGSIELIIGPMFVEKTTEVVRRVRRAALASTPSVLVKYSGDTRYERGAVVATHAEVRQASSPGSEERAPIRVVVAATLAAAELDEDEMVVGVDEGQFFPDLTRQCEAWAAEGRRVIVGALDGTFARRPFGQVCELVPLCESVEKQRGVCMACRRQASAFSQRLGGGTATIEVGGRESYRSVCRQCYFAAEPKASA